jgi:type VI secretion system secreted protein Hcp
MSYEVDSGTSRREVLRGGALGMGALVGAMGVAGTGVAEASAPDYQLAAAASATQHFWLQVAGIDGPSTTKGFLKQIPLLGYGWGATNSGTATGTGGGAGKVTMQPLIIRKHVDKASPKLFLTCATGGHVSTVLLQGTKPAAKGAQTVYFKIKLTNVLVSSFQQTESSDGVPIEVVHLAFAKVAYTVD